MLGFIQTGTLGCIWYLLVFFISVHASVLLPRRDSCPFKLTVIRYP
jgi:hypothetical protein